MHPVEDVCVLQKRECRYARYSQAIMCLCNMEEIHQMVAEICYRNEIVSPQTIFAQESGREIVLRS